MLSEKVILKRLQDKGWNGLSLSGRMENGTTALMVALSSIQGLNVYQDYDLVEALLDHPSTDVHARDNQGRNAVWFAHDFGYAFPLLVKAGVNFNQLTYDGEHHLLEVASWCDFDNERHVNQFMDYLEVSVKECGLDLLLDYRHQPLWMHLPSSLEPLIQILIAQQTKTQLSTLPPAKRMTQRTQKL